MREGEREIEREREREREGERGERERISKPFFLLSIFLLKLSCFIFKSRFILFKLFSNFKKERGNVRPQVWQQWQQWQPWQPWQQCLDVKAKHDSVWRVVDVDIPLQTFLSVIPSVNKPLRLTLTHLFVYLLIHLLLGNFMSNVIMMIIMVGTDQFIFKIVSLFYRNIGTTFKAKTS